MEIQLTKTKTITIGGGPAKHRKVDITGVDLFNGDSRGCPAVRLTEKKGRLHLAACGFVAPPSAPIPQDWDSASKSCTWSLPVAFQSPAAAIAVTSPDMFFAQTTIEEFRNDLAAGAHRIEASAQPMKVRLSIRKPAAASDANKASSGSNAQAPQSANSKKAPEAAPGEPVSNGGTRFVMKPMEKAEGFVMEAGLPEYQALWLTRLLPEGRRPTAVSVQVRPSALAASVIRLPEFTEAGGTALVLFMEDEQTRIAGYYKGDLVLWRNCPGVPGYNYVRDAVKKGLCLEDEMVESVLNDTLIDPGPVLEQAFAPVVNELALSRDYLVGKLGIEMRSVLAPGLRAGEMYFSALCEGRAQMKIRVPAVFGGIEAGSVPETPAAFRGALGAALAVISEGEEQ